MRAQLSNEQWPIQGLTFIESLIISSTASACEMIGGSPEIGKFRIARKARTQPSKLQCLMISTLNSTISTLLVSTSSASPKSNQKPHSLPPRPYRTRRLSPDHSHKLSCKQHHNSAVAPVRQQWITITRDALIKYGKAPVHHSTPIHSRHSSKCRATGLSFKQGRRSYTCEGTDSASLLGPAIIEIRRETLHDFNQESLRFIEKLRRETRQEQVFGSRERNSRGSRDRGNSRERENSRDRGSKIMYRTSAGTRPQYTTATKPEMYRPWSRQQPLFQQPNATLFP